MFRYKAPIQLTKGYIDSVMLAGSFNNWDSHANEYKMKNDGKGSFVLTLPKSSFRKEELYKFKFVINGNEWLTAPPYALNTDEKDAGQNLFFKIE